MQYVSVGIGGFIGAIMRFGIGILIPVQWLYGFPLSTLFVNWLGCFFLGWLSIYFAHKKLSVTLQQGIRVGVIGSFTTFSTFSVELIQLVQEGHSLMALLYFLLSLWGGLFLAWLGDRIAMKHSSQVGS